MQATLRTYLLAEGLGTAILLIFGTGAAVVDAQTHALGHGGVAAAFGLMVFILIQSLGETSGAHINPAVTVAFWARGRFPGRRVLPYAGAQLAGAALGSFLVKLIAGPGSDLGATLPAHGPWPALGIETFLTFWLMLVIFRVTSGPKEVGVLAGLVISATVALEALVAGPLTGASIPGPLAGPGPAEWQLDGLVGVPGGAAGRRAAGRGGGQGLAAAKRGGGGIAIPAFALVRR